MNYPHTEEAYLAGLLHDVGRLALLATAPKEYTLNFLALDDENLCAVEQRTLNITHTEAGACLIERWNLDSSWRTACFTTMNRPLDWNRPSADPHRSTGTSAERPR